MSTFVCLIEIDVSLPTITQHSTTMQKTIEGVQKYHIFCQINDAMNTQNGLSTSLIYDLFLNLLFLVFYEKKAGQSRL